MTSAPRITCFRADVERSWKTNMTFRIIAIFIIIVASAVKHATSQGEDLFTDCNFDAGTCRWASDKTCDPMRDPPCAMFGYNQWELHSGPSPNRHPNGTGPARDHTNLTSPADGRYMYVNSVQADGRWAYLVSPTIDVTSTSQYDYCLQFAYHMFGADVGSLSVFVPPVDILKVKHRSMGVWSRVFNQGDSWHMARVPFRCFEDCKVIFEADIQPVFALNSSDIAIDDVIITLGKSCNELADWPCSSERNVPCALDLQCCPLAVQEDGLCPASTRLTDCNCGARNESICWRPGN